MEILILGLLLVALMVYVSTRIKRSAADAYVKETIETSEFTLIKPEGFIVIPSSEPEVVFSAYSKDYGSDDADRFRQVAVEIRVHDVNPIGDVKRALIENAELIEEQNLAGGTVILETHSISGDVSFENEYRLVERNEKIYELRITALSETKEANQKNIDEILSSFELK